MSRPGRVAAGVAVGVLMRLWQLTIRRVARNRAAIAEPCVIAAWHGRLVGVLMDNIGSGLVTMSSRSSDGDFGASAVRTVGLRAARGSSSAGGLEALREMGYALRAGAPRAGLTVDGPKGPWRRVKVGAVALAIRHRIPLVPATFSCRRFWQLASWDRMLLPQPFTRMVVCYGKPWTPGRLRAESDTAPEAIGAELDEMARALDLELVGRELWPPRDTLA